MFFEKHALMLSEKLRDRHGVFTPWTEGAVEFAAL